MATRMKQRRGTHDQWISINNNQGPILEAGEIGYETDTNKFKIGDGTNHWIDLPYFLDENSTGGSVGDYILASTKGQINGVASLDSNGQVPISQLGNIIDGAPSALNTLNELAAALGDDANFLSTLATQTYVDTAVGNIDALPSQATNGGKFLTTDGSTASWGIVDLTTKQDVVSGVSSTEIGYLDGVTSGIQTQLNSKAPTADPIFTGIANITSIYNSQAQNIIQLNPEGFIRFRAPGASNSLQSTIGSGPFGMLSLSADGAIYLSPGSGSEAYIDGQVIATRTWVENKNYATQSYVGTQVSNLVNSAPSTLNTLKELADALSSDPNFATTITNLIATKIASSDKGVANGVASLDSNGQVPLTQLGNASSGASASIHSFAMIG